MNEERRLGECSSIESHHKSLSHSLGAEESKYLDQAKIAPFA